MFVILHMLDIAMGKTVLADAVRDKGGAFMGLLRLRVAELLGDVWRAYDYVMQEEKTKKNAKKSALEISDTVVLNVNESCSLNEWYESIVGGTKPTFPAYSMEFKKLLTKARNKVKKTYGAGDLRLQWLIAAKNVETARVEPKKSGEEPKPLMAKRKRRRKGATTFSRRKKHGQ